MSPKQTEYLEQKAKVEEIQAKLTALQVEVQTAKTKGPKTPVIELEKKLATLKKDVSKKEGELWELEMQLKKIDEDFSAFREKYGSDGE